MAITRALSEWSTEAKPLVHGSALGLARDAVIDIVGCMIAGAGDLAVKRACEAVADLGAGPATIVGNSQTLPAPHAALVNGTAAHALDFDDNYHPLAGHATAVLVPALLAMAEERRANGAAVLDAYIAGLEALDCIGNGVNLEHYERGWHSTSTIGTMGAAVACARLMSLDADGVQRAISLGFSLAGGSKLQFGSMAKPLHAGIAAQHGIMAARFAAAGISASDEPLDAPWGFRDLFAGPASSRYAEAIGRIGTPLAIERHGLKAKIHPCCASAHCAVDGVLALMKKNRLRAADIEHVDIVVNRVSYDNLRYPEPANEMEARFSMQYCVALAMVRGALRLTDFRAEALDDPTTRAWLPRVTMRLPDSGSELTRTDNGREPAEVHIYLKHGQMLSTFVQFAKGVLQNPLSDAEKWAKFDDCVDGVMGPARAAEVKACLEAFEALPRIGDLMTLLAGPKPRRPHQATRVPTRHYR
jgi:2-methylcitrate dehydratase PrpD